ncbi:SDR family NAD(P)-dependent oxidoreductase [Myxococcota bacterium]|nr:SDR family NAD(P)-dependent oxidoreductase [Myxococcota bacterium]
MNFEGKVAVITGGASGIGFGLAQQAANRGMKVVIADVEGPALETAVNELKAQGTEALGIETDVTRFEKVEALADRVFDKFGAVGLLCNNAGVNVTVTRPIWNYSRGDWEWLMGVNLWGVIHGVQAFLPRMLEQSVDSHVLNTCSAAGVIAGPGLAVYKVTKHGVLSLSESLYHDLRNSGSSIGVSVFLPDVVDTGLRASNRNRPDGLQDEIPKNSDEQAAEAMLQGHRGIDPAQAAQLAFEGLEAGRLYLFTSDATLASVRQRAADIEAGTPAPARTLRADLESDDSA